MSATTAIHGVSLGESLVSRIGSRVAAFFVAIGHAIVRAQQARADRIVADARKSGFYL